VKNEVEQPFIEELLYLVIKNDRKLFVNYGNLFYLQEKIYFLHFFINGYTRICLRDKFPALRRISPDNIHKPYVFEKTYQSRCPYIQIKTAP